MMQITWTLAATVGFLVALAVACQALALKSKNRLLMLVSCLFLLGGTLVVAAPFWGGGNWRNQALIAACKIGDTRAAEAALAGGADPNARDADGLTPLMHAAHGDRPSQTEPAITDHPDLVQLLLAQGADPNAATPSGFVALLWAARYGHEKVVRVLLEKGANPAAKDEDGMTALSWAQTNRAAAPGVYDRAIELLKAAEEKK